MSVDEKIANLLHSGLASKRKLMVWDGITPYSGVRPLSYLRAEDFVKKILSLIAAEITGERIGECLEKSSLSKEPPFGISDETLEVAAAELRKLIEGE